MLEREKRIRRNFQFCNAFIGIPMLGLCVLRLASYKGIGIQRIAAALSILAVEALLILFVPWLVERLWWDDEWYPVILGLTLAGLSIMIAVGWVFIGMFIISHP